MLRHPITFPPRRRLATLCLLALLSGWLASAAPAAGQSGQVDLAVVDIERLFKDSALAQSLIEQARAYRQQVEADLSEAQAELRQLREQLQQLSATSDRARELRREVQLREQALNTEQTVAQRELTLLQALGDLRVMNAAKQAISQVAQERDIDLVLRKAPPLPESYDPFDSNQRGQVEAMMTRQIALYADPGLDITSDVLLRMDESFQQGDEILPGGEPGDLGGDLGGELGGGGGGGEGGDQ